MILTKTTENTSQLRLIENQTASESRPKNIHCRQESDSYLPLRVKNRVPSGL